MAFAENAGSDKIGKFARFRKLLTDIDILSRSELRRVREENDILSEKNEKMQQNIRLNNTNEQVLQENHKGMATMINQIEHEFFDLESEHEQLRTENTVKSCQVQQLQKDKNELSNEMEEFRREIDGKNNEIQQLQEDKNEMSNEMEEFRREIDGKNNEIQQLQEDKNEMSNEMEEFRREIDAKNNEIQQLQGDKNEMSNEMEEFRREIDGKNNEIQQLLGDKNEMSNEMEEFRREIDGKNNEIQQLLGDKNELSNELEELRRDNANKGNEIQRLRQNAMSRFTIERGSVQFSTNNELGRGAWGAVYKGDFHGTNVAIKEYHNIILSPFNLTILQREINIASQCRHPNLLQFICASKDVRDRLLIVTELMDVSLRAFLEQHAKDSSRLEFEVLGLISLDVACGLNYLHSKQPNPLVHRDISSANVLLWMEKKKVRRAKISDYGSANFIDMCNTPNPGAVLYAAPEASQAKQDPKMDVFSYGILVCEISICEQPDVQDRRNQKERIVNDNVKQLVINCTRPDPQVRPAMQEVIEIWKRLLADNFKRKSFRR
ncbi:probable serine/threonine-protein kinase SIS8 [Dendronephthya gigantea]|uniref:probable serine/threonine-protein kinase SIS8 n=1 Tax=Dendronephthya gigantea TaxID=151771 RepID=UPI00106DCD2E|nr:probable serine/threonine-protein kinase SIS8 [Dendronephthya gigantea]